ncbi:MmcQ/YjbR family DNA-binding protein [Silvibacterium acidisoli]|uniref:MmcQ/YjbR family DNA-binding protein n=1 Tax=Acidobacteriaceae bacterium ZG23-2 TaxID=2883246 RepID=UPI00406CF8F0
MTVGDFRRIALSLEGAEESAHMGSPDFRVGGHIFATLAAQDRGYGNLMLSPEHQQSVVEEWPEIFLPVAGGWGRMGVTHLVLKRADEEIATGALRMAWKLRVEKNVKSKTKKRTRLYACWAFRFLSLRRAR